MVLANARTSARNMLRRPAAAAWSRGGTGDIARTCAVKMLASITDAAARYPSQNDGALRRAVPYSNTGQLDLRAAMQWVPRRTKTEAWRRKQDHFAREVMVREAVHRARALAPEFGARRRYC